MLRYSTVKGASSTCKVLQYLVRKLHSADINVIPFRFSDRHNINLWVIIDHRSCYVASHPCSSPPSFLYRRL